MNILAKIRRKVSLLRSLCLWQTWSIMKKSKLIGNAKVRVFNKSDINIADSAQLIVENGGLLNINQVNYRHRYIRPVNLTLHNGSTMICHGRFDMFEGADIYLNEGAKLEIGANTYMNASVIESACSIKIGDHCIIASGALIQDTDYHNVMTMMGGVKDQYLFRLL